MNQSLPSTPGMNYNTNLQETIRILTNAPPNKSCIDYRRYKLISSISYILLFISLIMAIFNSIHYTDFIPMQALARILVLFIFYIAAVYILFFVPFFLHRLFGTRTLDALMIIIDLLAGVYFMMMIRKSVDMRFALRPVVFVFGLNISVFCYAVEQKLKKNLYHASIATLYKTKILLLKTLFFKLLKLGVITFFSFITLFIHFSNLIANLDDEHDIVYLMVFCLIGLVIYLTGLIPLMSIKGKELEFMGYLLCINQKKRQHEFQKHQNNYNGMQQNIFQDSNSEDTHLTQDEFKKAAMQIKDKRIRDNFFKEHYKKLVFRYGNLPYSPSLESPFVITQELLNAIGFQGQGFPLRVFKNKGSFVYSVFYDVEIQQATDIGIASSFYNGYLSLIRRKKKFDYVGTLSFVFAVFTAFVTSGLFALYSIIHPNTNNDIVIFIQMACGLLFLSGMTIIGRVNRVVYGYGEALKYLLIDGRVRFRNNNKYEKKLREVMDKECERNLIT